MSGEMKGWDAQLQSVVAKRSGSARAAALTATVTFVPA